MTARSDSLYSPEVLGFVKSSNDLCKWLEDREIKDRETFVRQVLEILTRLYSFVIMIPRIDPIFNESNEKFVTEEDWSAVYRKIATLLGSQNEYNDIPDATEYDRTEMVGRKISEDLSDIYQELRDFLEVYRNSPEDIMNDALWECQTSFENSWGEKLLRASRALHHSYFEPFSDEDYSYGNEQDDSTGNFDTSRWIISKRQQESGNEE